MIVKSKRGRLTKSGGRFLGLPTPMPETAPIYALEAQVRECFGRVVYTHKTHAKMADRCERVLRRLKIGQIILSSITASGAVGLVFADDFRLKLITAIMSLGAVALNAYMKGFDPGAAAQKHWEAAADIWTVRESYLSLLTDLVAGDISLEVIRGRRDALQDKLATIYHGAPQTDPAAYGNAQIALKEQEEYSFSDSEIDAFLPKSLRLVGRPGGTDPA
jgi:SMODS and SLOG-associating 2TM effector domain family 4